MQQYLSTQRTPLKDTSSLPTKQHAPHIEGLLHMHEDTRTITSMEHEASAETISDTDEAVAMRVQAGDTESFGLIVERFEKKLLRYGTKFLSNRQDVQDVVQDVFIRVYQNIQSFDPTQRFSPWIYRIAHNTFVSKIRTNYRNPFLFFDFDTLIAHAIEEETPQTEHERHELNTMIEKGLDQIAPKYKEVIILYYIESLSYKEIADILSVPTGTVSIRLKRARDALKEVYHSMHMHY